MQIIVTAQKCADDGEPRPRCPSEGAPWGILLNNIRQ